MSTIINYLARLFCLFIEFLLDMVHSKNAWQNNSVEGSCAIGININLVDLLNNCVYKLFKGSDKLTKIVYIKLDILGILHL